MGANRLFLGVILAATAAGADGQLQFKVQVYNNANAPSQEVRQAAAEAGRIFERAGILVTWMNCRPREATSEVEPGCEPTGDPRVLVMGINRGKAPNGAEAALGFALVHGRSNHAAALYQAISALVEDNPQYRDSTVLGSVIAHELAHLLFRSTRHGEGLMRAKWDGRDYQKMAQRNLTFTAQQAQTLRKMLAARTGGEARPADSTRAVAAVQP